MPQQPVCSLPHEMTSFAGDALLTLDAGAGIHGAANIDRMQVHVPSEMTQDCGADLLCAAFRAVTSFLQGRRDAADPCFGLRCDKPERIGTTVEQQQ